MKHITNIIISRTDSIGDVVLTLPMVKVLKETLHNIKIGFMGKTYTKAVIEACEYVDEFIDVDHFLQNKITVCGKSPQCIVHVFPVPAIAKRAKELKIPLRIGTINRFYHWYTCNELVKLSRKKSDLHEAQLNLKLLSVFGIHKKFSLKKIRDLYCFSKMQPLDNNSASLVDRNKYNLVLHPKSQGSAREWGLDHFISLIHSLPKDKYKIFISGTEKERALLQPLFDAVQNEVTDICGTMTLAQFISFINACDGLVACSTGPLHIAAALGKDTYGIYPPVKPMHPGRWAPIGNKAEVFVLNKQCNDCRNNANECHCIKEVLPLQVSSAIEKHQR